MKLFSLTPIKQTLILLFAFLIIGTGCEVFNVEDKPDPNNVGLSSVVNNPSQADIATLVTGTLSGIREPIEQYFIDVGMVGREMYRFLAAEPRFTQDLMGGGNSELDSGSFYITNPWADIYTNIRMTNILLQALDGEVNGITPEGVSGAKGFAKTLQAYQYLLALNLTNENGIVQQNETDVNAGGALLNKEAGFALINQLLDSAVGDLNSGGSSFSFLLPPGFNGFDTPATFLQFNRALRARLAAYTSDWQGVSSALQGSFIDASVELTNGVYHDFSTNPGDLENPIFNDPQAGAGDSWVAHPTWAPEAEAGDTRVDEKTVVRNSQASLDGLSSNFGLFVYKTNVSQIPIIRNAELLLIRAEYNINKSNPDLQAAVNDLNIIRNAAGLPNYNGAVTQAALLDEMLNQRRYELFMEGHRWVDMRRYNRLDELPIDRANDNVWLNFPIPENENL